MKRIWIMNHYATNMYYNGGGRHYWFGEGLIRRGYEPSIFCASTRHNSNDYIDIDQGLYRVDEREGIPFVFLKVPKYGGNGLKRIINMYSFYKGLLKTYKAYIRENGKPDIILASSVHPLTLVAGIKIGKKLGIPCICEVRDLWPESLVSYGSLRRNSLLAKILYRGEKWIYKKADSIIMTWEGGYKYIEDRGWTDEIKPEKVFHISNGLVVDRFDKNSEDFVFKDEDLDNEGYKNIVYTGSIRKVNNLGMILDTAKIIGQVDKTIRFVIFGTGSEEEELRQRCKDENIDNVIFKGKVDKNMVPSILKRAYINILHNLSTDLDKYGQSQNKLFEYLAAGRCVVQTYTTAYSVLERYNCGLSVKEQDPESIAGLILDICKDEERIKQMGANARRAAYDFDFEVLTDKLVEVMNDS